MEQCGGKSGAVGRWQRKPQGESSSLDPPADSRHSGAPLWNGPSTFRQELVSHYHVEELLRIMLRRGALVPACLGAESCLATLSVPSCPLANFYF